jgi:hypothetical protein
MKWRLILAVATLLASPAALPESFRCGHGIVSGDSTVEEVLAKCGEPTTKTTETIDVYGHSDAGGGNIKRGTATIETWTYDRGSQSFPMVVTIENGKLKSVERGPG